MALRFRLAFTRTTLFLLNSIPARSHSSTTTHLLGKDAGSKNFRSTDSWPNRSSNSEIFRRYGCLPIMPVYASFGTKNSADHLPRLSVRIEDRIDHRMPFPCEPPGSVGVTEGMSESRSQIRFKCAATSGISRTGGIPSSTASSIAPMNPR